MQRFPPPDLFSNPIIQDYTVLAHIPSQINFLLKLRIALIDESVLFTNERLQKGIRKYSFHWQEATGSVLMRWDNAPHYRNIRTFPHHKHDYLTGQEVITDSFDISLAEVLEYIQAQLQKPAL